MTQHNATHTLKLKRSIIKKKIRKCRKGTRYLMLTRKDRIKKSKTGNKKKLQKGGVYPKMLLCVIGGLSYMEDEVDFLNSELGKLYKHAINSGNCDVMVIDPKHSEHGNKMDRNDSTNVFLAKLFSLTNIKEKSSIIFSDEDAKETDYSKIISNDKYKEGGVCFAIDTVGRDIPKFSVISWVIRNRIGKLLDIYKKKVPISVFQKPMDNTINGWMKLYPNGIPPDNIEDINKSTPEEHILFIYGEKYDNYSKRSFGVYDHYSERSFNKVNLIDEHRKEYKQIPVTYDAAPKYNTNPKQKNRKHKNNW